MRQRLLRELFTSRSLFVSNYCWLTFIDSLEQYRSRTYLLLLLGRDNEFLLSQKKLEMCAAFIGQLETGAGKFMGGVVMNFL